MTDDPKQLKAMLLDAEREINDLNEKLERAEETLRYMFEKTRKACNYFNIWSQHEWEIDHRKIRDE